MSNDTLRFETTPTPAPSIPSAIIWEIILVHQLYSIVLNKWDTFGPAHGPIHILAIVAIALFFIVYHVVLWYEFRPRSGSDVLELNADGIRHTLKTGEIIEARWSDFEDARLGSFYFRNGIWIHARWCFERDSELYDTAFRLTGNPTFAALARRARARNE